MEAGIQQRRVNAVRFRARAQRLGQLDTAEYTERIERPFWFDSENDRVEFQHDMVWVPGVLDNFGTLDRAYEHDLKTSTDALTLGSRGFIGCAIVRAPVL